eukprot:6190398-Pleurochrysis_carterae.AAC.5
MQAWSSHAARWFASAHSQDGGSTVLATSSAHRASSPRQLLCDSATRRCAHADADPGRFESTMLAMAVTKGSFGPKLRATCSAAADRPSSHVPYETGVIACLYADTS